MHYIIVITLRYEKLFKAINIKNIYYYHTYELRISQKKFKMLTTNY